MSGKKAQKAISMEGLNYHKIEIVIASPDPIFGANSWVDTLKEAALSSRDEESEMNSFVTARCVESRGEFIDSDDEDDEDDDDDEDGDDNDEENEDGKAQKV